MVTTFYPPYHFGGDAVFVRGLARALVRRGHQVDVVHCEDAYRLRPINIPAISLDSEVKVHRLSSSLKKVSPLITQQTGRPGLKRKKLQAIFEKEFDVVNFHNISLIGGPKILSMSRAPINIYTLHEHWLLCSTHVFWKNRKMACDKRECFVCSIRSGIPPQFWRYTNLVHRNLARVDALIAPSKFTARVHQAAGFSPPIYVLPSFSPLNPGPELKLPEGERPRFVFVGRVTASKGISSLAKAFSNWKDYDLWIVGDGDLRVELENKYQKCSNIRFLGHIEEIELIDIYQTSTALILPAIGPEAFPLCVIEGFACSLPAIVRDAGGAREAIDRTGAGFVYDTNEELRIVLQKLVTNPELQKELRLLARSGYEKYYTSDHYLAGYLGLIESKKREKQNLIRAGAL
jgi:glycosyltransferase involved in cell wall biosynthesis